MQHLLEEESVAIEIFEKTGDDTRLERVQKRINAIMSSKETFSMAFDVVHEASKKSVATFNDDVEKRCGMAQQCERKLKLSQKRKISLDDDRVFRRLMQRSEIETDDCIDDVEDIDAWDGARSVVPLRPMAACTTSGSASIDRSHLEAASEGRA